jgi:hypothetical protein
VEKETEKHYEALVDMFATEGWKMFTDELKNNAVQINSVEATKDKNDLYFRKGQLNVISFMLNMESTVEHLINEDSNDSF